MRIAPKIELTDTERAALLKWSRGRSTASRLVLRAKIVLAAAEGLMNQTIAAKVGTSKKTVSLWRTRFTEQRLAGIEQDAPRPGRKTSISAETTVKIVTMTTTEKPANATHWSTRSMAQKVGVSKATVALEMADGLLYGTCMQRHRHQEWIKFLKLLDEQTPPDYDLHLILDNYATHKHPQVKAWIARHPRFKLHFIPTSSSWLNLVERLFRNLTQLRLRRGAFRNVPALRAAIYNYIDQHNEDPKPMVWNAQAEQIIAKVGRARAKLNKTPSV